ncbi:phosphate/phosphite/phosphonate ABC transporter substrate-binding protein, partial [Falsiroseomonas oryzae]|uniref:phosphate/phosphite/phosphonate ABC transporter substrate-binding protein n=1 Tax=Falsiroseomonas oryzae TaxID=2766473 RepID=UPI0022EA2914
MTTLAARTRRQALALLGLAPFAPAAAQSPPASHPMPPAGRRPWADQVRELRIGLLSDENQADRMARTRAYRDLLSTHFGVPARIYEAADYAGVMQGFAARQLEISNMGALVYARIWLDTNGNIEPLVVALAEDGSASYFAMMYVRADSNIRSLEEMRGRSLAWADPNSTSGFLVPRSELREAGINIDTFFSRTGFAGGHEQA